jgi:hypothetical protein
VEPAGNEEWQADSLSLSCIGEMPSLTGVHLHVGLL